jgi:hypothetical protein
MQVGCRHYYMTITNTTRSSPRLGYTQQTSLLAHLTHRITARNVLGLVQVEDLHDSWGYVARFISPLVLVSPDYLLRTPGSRRRILGKKCDAWSGQADGVNKYA